MSRNANRSRHAPLIAVPVVLGLFALTACSDPAGAAAGSPKAKVGNVTYDLSATQSHITSKKNDAIAAELPADVGNSGVLVIGSGGAGGGIPPLAFTAEDNKTPIGVEIDVADLIASILGLKPKAETTSFENLFLGLDSGRFNVGISNIGVSELRKQKYDFATYRLGLHAFEAKKGSGLKVSGAADIAGKTVAVASGTLQEAILLRWNQENIKAGRAPAELKYYQLSTDYYLALQSGRVQLYLGPNPVAAYHVATAKQTEIVGTVSSSFPITGLVGVATKKGNGLVKPLSDALNVAIKDGSYAKVLAKWGLQSEAVTKSEVNPPGLSNAPSK